MRVVYLPAPVEIEMDQDRQDEIVKRIAEDRCIRGCERPVHCRGLCKECDSQFRSVRQSKKTEKERAAFERSAIEAGMVLAPNEQRRLRPTTNPFANVGSEVPDHVA
ncbi:hypothetical protein [Rhodopirellula bahusiensis]|uniref:hypothetical protein n=1 Tax=Rhodopirellula bahusiensis TaxID=2014065 RepID=UPI003262F827